MKLTKMLSIGPRKTGIAMLLCFALCTITFEYSEAQTSTAQDTQQLILDIEKLTQFKAILSDMQAGYTILTQGYSAVKNISEGNFNLHSVFLNSLMAVSPQVKKYGRIADIIADQASIVSEYKAAWKQANRGGHFNAQELSYMNNVFQHLLSGSIDNLTNLANVVTAGTLRMSDADRLGAIDQIYADTQHKLVFLRHFTSQVAVLSAQRQKATDEIQTFKNLY
ncbi:TerB family tellurite resistance protein [Mucilaginibacter sp. R-33]|uniref:TerB family tellurite resistance protein n=1 Tax=Mucilaginibacter sp. R-33 TaxID=3416711 RepID=UPI003CFBB2A2